MTTDEKIAALAAVIENQTLERLKAQGFSYPGFENSAKTMIIPGRKYTKIDIGTINRSGKLMIERETERIYGIKGYGQVHKGHYYGTLDTVDSFYWGDYYPRPI